VLAHQSPGDSPGAGVMAATRTSSDTGRRSQTRGAVKAPSDCATTMTSRRGPTASTTHCAYSARPARSSSHGKSTATTSCPAARSLGATRCQYHESLPAPWRSA
jgi:hypothetical protein